LPPRRRSAFEQAEQVGRQIGGNLVFSDWFAAARAEMALAAGTVPEVEQLAERAVARAHDVNGIYAEALAQRT